MQALIIGLVTIALGTYALFPADAAAEVMQTASVLDLSALYPELN